MRRISLAFSAFFFFGLVACTSPKKKTELSLKDIEGKKVALTAIDAQPTTRTIIEVSLVNELLKHGSFILIPKQEIELIKNKPLQDPLDELGVAQKAGADFALQIRVLDFSAETREGYSREEIFDSQIAEEQGTDGKTQHLFKVKELTGRVELEWKWTQLATDLSLKTKTEAQDHIKAEAKTSAIHLPLRMQFLTQITQKAIRQFFNQLLR